MILLMKHTSYTYLLTVPTTMPQSSQVSVFHSSASVPRGSDSKVDASVVSIIVNPCFCFLLPSNHPSIVMLRCCDDVPEHIHHTTSGSKQKLWRRKKSLPTWFFVFSIDVFFRLTDYHTTDTQTYYYHTFFIYFLFWKKYGYDIGRSSCSPFGCYYPHGGFHAYLDIWCKAGTDDDFESNDVIVLSVLLRLIDEEQKIVYEKLLYSSLAVPLLSSFQRLTHWIFPVPFFQK